MWVVFFNVLYPSSLPEGGILKQETQETDTDSYSYFKGKNLSYKTPYIYHSFRPIAWESGAQIRTSDIQSLWLSLLIKSFDVSVARYEEISKVVRKKW